MKREQREINPIKKTLCTLLSLPKGKVECVWSIGSTNSKTGKSELPEDCRAHRCLGRFAEKPMVEELSCFMDAEKLKVK